MAETPQYNREEIYGDKREKMKQEISRDKNKIKYDTSTPEGKAKLSEAWMNRAHLSDAQKEHIFKKLGLNSTPDLKTEAGQRALTSAVKKWQEAPEQKNNRGTIGKADGILGWATLEALDNDNSLAGVQGEKTDIQQELVQQRKKKLTQLAEDMYSRDRAITDDLKDLDGNRLQLVTDKRGQRLGVIGTGDNDGKIYSLETGLYGGNEILITDKLKKQGKYVDAEGRNFIVIKTEKGNLAVRGTIGGLSNPEYFNSNTKKWENYTPEIRSKMNKKPETIYEEFAKQEKTKKNYVSKA